MKNILEYISENSNYVSVNKNRIKTFIENVSNWQYNYWMNDLKTFLDEKNASCLLLFVKQ